MDVAFVKPKTLCIAAGSGNAAQPAIELLTGGVEKLYAGG